MKRYRKKPVEISAYYVSAVNINQAANWCGGRVVNNTKIEIDTLEGVMTAQTGDYIIKGVQGEFYPCKPDIFKATYEPV